MADPCHNMSDYMTVSN